MNRDYEFTFEDMCRHHLAIYHGAGQIVKTEEKISFLPRMCRISGKSLWFKRATMLTRKFDPGAMLGNRKERLWVDSKEYTLFILSRP